MIIFRWNNSWPEVNFQYLASFCLVCCVKKPHHVIAVVKLLWWSVTSSNNCLGSIRPRLFENSAASILIVWLSFGKNKSKVQGRSGPSITIASFTVTTRHYAIQCPHWTRRLKVQVGWILIFFCTTRNGFFFLAIGISIFSSTIQKWMRCAFPLSLQLSSVVSSSLLLSTSVN